MYFKKILFAIVLIGLIIAGYFAYYVYSTMLASNTGFANEEAYIYIPSNASYQDVREDLIPLLKNIKTFDALAKRKRYTTNIKAGKYKIYRPLYITYNPNSPRLADIKKFIKFCHSKAGRTAMKKNGVVPYKEALSLIMKQIEQDDSAFKRGLKFDLETL